MGTRDNVPQTHRTILFEVFNDSEHRLDLLLNPNVSTDSEDRNSSIDQKLSVKSFAEFLEKFSPTVYEYFTQDGSGRTLASYTLDSEEAKQRGGTPISITGHAYYQMLSQLYTDKGTSGKSNIKFDDKKIKEILTPEREVKTAYNLRGELLLINRRLQEAEAGGQTAKVKSLEKNLERCMDKVRKAYMSSKIQMLPIAHADAVKKIKLLDERIAIAETSVDDSTAGQPRVGRLGFAKDGALVLLPPAEETQPLSNKSDVKLLAAGNADSDQKLIELVANDYDSRVEKQEGDFTRGLILSVYTPKEVALSLDDMNKAELIEQRDQLIERKDSYEKLLAQSKQEFVSAVSTVIQKILGVKIFFDHATIEGADKGKLSPPLLVANCRPEDLLQDDVRKNFEEFIEHYGVTEKSQNKIWFAILPHIENPCNFGLDDDYIDDTAATFEEAKTLLEILEKSRIMTVFNFAATRETTFAGITADAIKEIKQTFQDEQVRHEHAVFAYPNFTLMTATQVHIAGEESIEIPPTYIDAAYVAAGLLVGVQQPSYLQKHGFSDRVDKDNVCVRVDMEDEELVGNITTKLNPEMTYTWQKSITDEISSEQFGFAFCSNNKFISAKNKYLKNAYILCARTLAKDGKYYQPIYRRLAKDFIIAYIKERFGANPKKAEIKKGLPRIVNEWSRQAQQKSTCNNVNLILRADEDVQYDTPEYPDALHLKFSKYDEIISADDLKVITEDAGGDE